MRTLVFAAALLALAACGEENDDRPPTAEYLVSAIFRPACGTAACHSTATGRSGFIADTVDGVCEYELTTGPTGLFLVGEGGVPSWGNRARMPLDSPLPKADIALIRAWEQIGTDSGVFPGCP